MYTTDNVPPSYPLTVYQCVENVDHLQFCTLCHTSHTQRHLPVMSFDLGGREGGKEGRRKERTEGGRRRSKEELQFKCDTRPLPEAR